jgi:hypothetical protein
MSTWKRIKEFYQRNEKYMIAEILMYATMIIGIIILFLIFS